MIKSNKNNPSKNVGTEIPGAPQKGRTFQKLNNATKRTKSKKKNVSVKK